MKKRKKVFTSNVKVFGFAIIMFWPIYYASGEGFIQEGFKALGLELYVICLLFGLFVYVFASYTDFESKKEREKDLQKIIIDPAYTFMVLPWYGFLVVSISMGLYELLLVLIRIISYL